MKRPPRSHLINAFTLIELLTVIAIIGILAAIIIPVTAKVRNKARGMQCLSNLRQLQTANILYAEEHKDKYVPLRDDSYGTTGTGSSKWWHGNYDYLAILSPRTRVVEQLKCPLGKALYSDSSNEKTQLTDTTEPISLIPAAAAAHSGNRRCVKSSVLHKHSHSLTDSTSP